MHLDCVFSLLGDNICLMLKDMMGEDSPTRRLVDEHVQVHGCAGGLCAVGALHASCRHLQCHKIWGPGCALPRAGVCCQLAQLSSALVSWVQNPWLRVHCLVLRR